MDSLTFCYEKTIPCDKINNSPLGRNLEVSKHPVTPSLTLITEDKEYESTDGWKAPPLKAPRWNHTQLWYKFIGEHGMDFNRVRK